jgi:hypothetical protein
MARSRGGRATCEVCQSLDVRKLQREGRLLTYQSFPVSWRFGDEVYGGIHIHTEPNVVILRFQSKSPERSDWKLVEQNVPIAWTACALGGQRPWFVCTALVARVRCGRRVAKIYLGGSPIFACRHCHRLAYASQSKSAFFRDIAKAMNIRMRLGGSPNLFDPFPQRPKGLHRRTYQRLQRIHDAAESRLSQRSDG